MTLLLQEGIENHFCRLTLRPEVFAGIGDGFAQLYRTHSGPIELGNHSPQQIGTHSRVGIENR